MPRNPRRLSWLEALALLSCALASSAGAAQSDPDKTVPPLAVALSATSPATPVARAGDTKPAVWVSETFGVEVHGARLSASGYVIDLRYRVLDAEKARPLLDRKVLPVLVDETTGERFYIPQPPVVGALRQTSRNNAIALGKNYFMIFANPDQRIKAGQTLALYIGDQSFGNLRIDP